MTSGRSRAFQFVILFGVVNLFADLTYEGGRSVTGPFLAQLGATAAVISIVSGAAEFLGYALRAVAGYLADKTKRYWTFTFVGYAINLLAVPALALAGSWPSASVFIAAERTGRAIRRPIVQGMLSHTKGEVGGGLAFGINESLDALGATVGPLVIALVLARGGSYRAGFATLLIAAALSLVMLAITRRRYPHPQTLEAPGRADLTLGRSYWIWLIAAGLIGFGFVDFSLIAFHLQRTGVLQREAIPLAYATAMGVGAVGNLALGRLYDRVGMAVIVGVFLVGACFTPLVFFGRATFAFIGAALWGVNKGAQDTLFKPMIAPLIAPSRRTSAFGIFDTVFGVFWVAGSVAFGLLYDKSLTALVTLSVVTQLLSLPLFMVGSATAKIRKTS